ncbi:MAG: TonB-dependent siderophore receptor [Rhodospirillaceae bacterium]|nr:TonB-dependent siderophore receptor [Rhodospirillaceae bacterium]
MTGKGNFKAGVARIALLAAGISVAGALAHPVRADAVAARAGAGGQAAGVEAAQATRDRAMTFDIAAGPLPAALAAFGERTGLQVLYPSAVARDARSPGVQGTMTPDAALARLLEGTGLSHRFSAADTVTVTAPGQEESSDRLTLGTVSVEGRAVPSQAEIGNLPPAYAGGQVARGGKLGMLGNRDMMETPFNQTSYTAELIENQQARTVRDVVANDPAAFATWPGTGYTDPLKIRGFEASNQDVAFGGLYGVAPTFNVGMGMAERVEILKGPAALLGGMTPLGSVGGTVNITPKRATDDPITRVVGTYANSTQLGGQVDVGRRLGRDKEFGVRINGSLEDGDTAVDDQYRTFVNSIAGLDYRGDRLRLSADLGYQLQNINGPSLVTNISSGIAVPDAPDASSNWFFPWGWVDAEDFFGAARAEYDLTPDWTGYIAVGAKRTHWGRLTYFPSVKNSDGDLSATPSHLKYIYDTNTQEAGVRGNLTTGAISHDVSLSVTRFHRTQKSGNENIGSAITSNLYAPATHGGVQTSDLATPKTAESEFVSIAFGDVLSVYDDRVQLILGGRLQRIKAQNFSSTTGLVTSDYNQSTVSPAIGFVGKPWNKISVYGNYIEGLQQGAVVGSTYANAGENLAPYISKQMELGVKADLGDFGATLAIFQITQPSAAADASNNLTSDGQQRNRGMELSVFGNVMEDLRILGGMALTDATLTATADGANNDNNAPGVPGIQINLGVEWDTPFVPGLTLTGRGTFTGEQHIDNANTKSLPSWARFDIGMRYKIDRPDMQPFTVRFNIDNVMDHDYWASSYYPGYISTGAPRTFRLSLATDF